MQVTPPVHPCDRCQRLLPRGDGTSNPRTGRFRRNRIYEDYLNDGQRLCGRCLEEESDRVLRIRDRKDG